MRLKNLNGVFPPGGWYYRQPETGWETPMPMVNNREATVSQIRAHRGNNSRFRPDDWEAQEQRVLRLSLPERYYEAQTLTWTTNEELIGYQLEYRKCVDLGFDPDWCENPPKSLPAQEGVVIVQGVSAPLAPAPCKTCG